jgi:uncharacterized protein (TIGR02444 family)
MADSDFWQFCNDFYQIPDVETACLHLQDKHNVNVVMLLLCIWLGQRGELLTPSLCQNLWQEVSRWSREAVEPIRGARRWLGLQPMSAALYQHVKDAELAVEKSLILHLEEICRQNPRQLANGNQQLCAKKNASFYLLEAGIALDNQGSNTLGRLIGKL